MSKKSSTPKVEVTEYSLAMHLGICSGPVGALRRILIGDKAAYGSADGGGSEPPVRESTALSINKPNLHGGEQKEGGAVGTVTVQFGAEDQTVPEHLAARLGRTEATTPGFRGLLALWFTNGSGGFIWSHNSPYLKPVWVEVERLPGIDGMDWYPETAAIPRVPFYGVES